MKKINQNKNQQAVIAAYSASLKAVRSGGTKLTQEKSATVALATIDALHNDQGKPLSLTPDQRNTLKVLFHPKPDIRLKVIEATLKAAGCTMDGMTREMLDMLLTPASFDKKMEERAKVTVVDWSEIVSIENGDESTPVVTPAEEEASV